MLLLVETRVTITSVILALKLSASSNTLGWKGELGERMLRPSGRITFIVYLLLCIGSHLMLRAADYRNNTVPARSVFSVIIALAVTTVCESHNWTKAPVVCLLQKDSMVTQQWLQLHGHWAQNWICVLHIKKIISIITRRDKKKKNPIRSGRGV